MGVILKVGDDYGRSRPFDQLEFVTDELAPFDLSGCTLLTTWKTAVTDPATDPDDSSAVFTGALVVDAEGVPTTQDGIYLIGDATAGTVQVRLFKADTNLLPVGESWMFDYSLTDSDGETETWTYDAAGDLVSAEWRVTNRTGVS